MKVRLLLIALLFSVVSILTTSCGGGTSSDPKECDPTCEAFQECNTSNGKCETRDGFCATADECDGTDVCDANHKCAPAEDPLCNGRCLDQDGNKKGTCSVVGGLPVCECDTDYLASPNKLRCLEATGDCGTAAACGGYGECVADNDGNLACLCDEDYLPDATDPLLCVMTEVCSNSNHNGTCEKSCESCLDDGTGNWECKVPVGQRPCSGDFNDLCDPSLGWWQNPACGSNMLCEGTNADDGYCTHIECKVDSDCLTTYGDQFVCRNFDDGTNSYGICVKAPDQCFNDDGTRIGGGQDGDRCGDTCQDAECNVGNICNGGVCSAKCSPMNDTCLAAAAGTRKCSVVSPLFSDVNSYYCTLIADLGESCFDGAACDSGLICLGDQETWANCYKECTAANANTICGQGVTCNILNGVDFGYCDAAPTADVGESCKEGVVGCLNDGWCLGSIEDAHCYQSCNGTDDTTTCAGGQPCNELGDGQGGIAGYYCEPVAEKTQDINEECDSFTAACMDGGLCLGYEGQQNHCFKECTAASDASDECPGNQACIALGDSGQFYCNPDAPKENAAGEECNEFSGCLEGSTCLTFQNGGSYCFAECDATATDTCATDVGAGSTCTDLGTVGTFCSGAKTATKFEACGLVEDCEAGLVCLTAPNADTGYCYDECTAATDCSADETCTPYSQDGSSFCMTECMSDSDCSIDKVCSTDTFTCVVPTPAPICTAGDKRCMNDDVETCNATGSAWELTTDCTAPAVCEDATYTCETPEATACATNGCDTVGVTSCTDADTMATCTLDSANNCLELVETDCDATAPECFENVTNNIYACYPAQTVDCTTDTDCAANLNGLTTCDTGDTNMCVAP